MGNSSKQTNGVICDNVNGVEAQTDIQILCGTVSLFVPIGMMYRNKSQNCMIFQVELIPVSVFIQGS